MPYVAYAWGAIMYMYPKLSLVLATALDGNTCFVVLVICLVSSMLETESSWH